MKAVYIMLTYNGGNMPIDAIKSILEVEGENTPIILVDNGSPRGYTKWLTNKLKNMGFGKEGKWLLSLKENKKWAGGNNEGMKFALSKGFDIGFLVNDDIIVKSPTLRFIERFMEENKDVGIVGPFVEHGDKPYMEYSEQDWLYIFLQILLGTKIRNIIWSLLGRELLIDRKIRHPIPVGWVLGAAMAVKLDVAKRVGFFPNTRWVGYEEHLLSCMFRNIGYKTYYVPQGHIYHIGDKTLSRRGRQDPRPVMFYLGKCFHYPSYIMGLVYMAYKLDAWGMTLPRLKSICRRVTL